MDSVSRLILVTVLKLILDNLDDLKRKALEKVIGKKVIGQRLKVKGQRSKVKGQRSKVKGQKYKVKSKSK